MKRILSVILVLGLLTGVLAVSASATTEPALKKDLSNAIVTVHSGYFTGMPVEPKVRVFLDGVFLTAGEDYVVCYEQNVNVGEAIAVVIGCGNCCGTVRKTFQIEHDPFTTTVSLKGNYLGVAGGQLNEENIYYDEKIISPGRVQFVLDCDVEHAAAYQLYRVEGEAVTLVKSWEGLYGDKFDTDIEYEFTSVYEEDYEQGGGVYLMSYAWADAQSRLYGGAMVLAVPAKVAPAATMKVEKLPDVGNFRTQYVTYYSEDGALELPQWTTSDSSVATVQDGVVTFKKPGSVTVTAKCGKLSDSITLSASRQDLTKASLFTYSANTGKATLHYDGYLLAEGVDYTLSATAKGGATEVTVIGINLFQGKLIAEFDENGHAHSFDADCDPTCNGCDYVRDATHIMTTHWAKDKLYHWHFCTACGEVQDKVAHTVTDEAPDICTVCGELSPVGDLDGNAMVNEDDAVYLLQHVLMPDFFPVDQPVDYDRNGKLDEDDAVYLLQHVLMPDLFPLS